MLLMSIVPWEYADQFLNKRNDLLMLIAGNEPDLILIAEVIPKARLVYMSSSRLYIPGYTSYSNFDPDSNQFTGLRGICIYVSNNLRSSEVHLL